MTAHSIAPTTPDLILAPRAGWRSGFGNLLRKELGQWWGTRLWWIQTLTWFTLLNGITTVIMFDPEGIGPEAMVRESIQGFLLMGLVVTGIGVVLTVQGSIVGEKELGTAEWLMSKPTSRAAYVLAKICAHSLGFVVTAVVIPSAVFIATASYLVSEPIPLVSFSVAVAVMAMNVLFYVVLTVTLGCFFRGRGPIAGIGIGLILFGQFFKGMLPRSVVLATPWLLGDIAASFPLESSLDFDRRIPLAAVGLEILVLAAVAIWRFEREEF